LAGEATLLADGSIEIRIGSRRFAWGVRAAAAGFLPDDAYFGLEPGGKRQITLAPLQRAQASPAAVTVTAINAEGSFKIPIGAAA
jgi:hypothetical protein